MSCSLLLRCCAAAAAALVSTAACCASSRLHRQTTNLQTFQICKNMGVFSLSSAAECCCCCCCSLIAAEGLIIVVCGNVSAPLLPPIKCQPASLYTILITQKKKNKQAIRHKFWCLYAQTVVRQEDDDGGGSGSDSGGKRIACKHNCPTGARPFSTS